MEKTLFYSLLLFIVRYFQLSLMTIIIIIRLLLLLLFLSIYIFFFLAQKSVERNCLIRPKKKMKYDLQP